MWIRGKLVNYEGLVLSWENNGVFLRIDRRNSSEGKSVCMLQ